MSMASCTASPSRLALGLDKTTRLVARMLGMTPDTLTASFRPARQDELDAVLALRQQVLGPSVTWDDRVYLAWRYGLGGSDGLAECWVVARDAELLAMVGMEPLTLTAGAARMPAHVTMDIMVRPDLDGSGLGVWINQAVCARLPCVLAVGSNANSRGMIARTFEPLPNRCSWVHPLHFKHFLAKRLNSPVLASVAAALADVAGAAWRTLMWRGRSLGVTVSEVQALDAACRQLLAQPGRPDRVEVHRDAERWTRRVFGNPRTHVIVLVARRVGQVIGLLAVRPAPGEAGRLTWQVLDMVLDPAHQRAAALALLARAASLGQALGADYLIFTSYDASMEPLLTSMPFKAQPHEFETMAWRCDDAVFRAAVGASVGWTLTDLHTDRDSA